MPTDHPQRQAHNRRCRHTPRSLDASTGTQSHFDSRQQTIRVSVRASTVSASHKILDLRGVRSRGFLKPLAQRPSQAARSSYPSYLCPATQKSDDFRQWRSLVDRDNLEPTLVQLFEMQYYDDARRSGEEAPDGDKSLPLERVGDDRTHENDPSPSVITVRCVDSIKESAVAASPNDL